MSMLEFHDLLVGNMMYFSYASTRMFYCILWPNVAIPVNPSSSTLEIIEAQRFVCVE